MRELGYIIQNSDKTDPDIKDTYYYLFNHGTEADILRNFTNAWTKMHTYFPTPKNYLKIPRNEVVSPCLISPFSPSAPLSVSLAIAKESPELKLFYCTDDRIVYRHIDGGSLQRVDRDWFEFYDPNYDRCFTTAIPPPGAPPLIYMVTSLSKGRKASRIQFCTNFLSEVMADEESPNALYRYVELSNEQKEEIREEGAVPLDLSRAVVHQITHEVSQTFLRASLAWNLSSFSLLLPLFIHEGVDLTQILRILVNAYALWRLR